MGPATPADEADRIRRISSGRVRFSFTGSRKLLEMVERAGELLKHKHPNGRLDVIFEQSLGLFLRRLDPARKTRRKRAKRLPSSGGSRRVPRHVKIAVWRRDRGRCAFLGEDGRRCAERDWIEFDHIIPWALGGRSDDPGNVRLLCRAHNQYCARRTFGDGFIDSKQRRRRMRNVPRPKNRA